MKSLHFPLMLIALINAEDYSPICPTGFDMIYDEKHQSFICYQEKKLETFQNKFDNCKGNLYDSELLQKLNISKTTDKLWTEFTSLYPGGPFANWKYSEEKQDILFNISNRSLTDDSKKLCLINDDKDYIAVDCEEKHKRYCFVKPYSVKTNWEVCENFKPSYKFYSPEEVCLMNISIKPGLTWHQARDLCEFKNGTLLSKGWIYMNMPLFSNSSIYPLDKMFNSDAEELHAVDLVSEKNHADYTIWEGDNPRLWAVENGFLHYVEKNYIFSEIICEKSIIYMTKLDLNVNWENQVVLSISGRFDKSDIYCFTDSLTYHPSKITIHHVKNDNTFILSPKDDGYYWCVYIHPKTLQETYSNRFLFINKEHNLWNLYAVKIYVSEYDIENLDKIKFHWKEKLDEYILYLIKNKSIDNVMYEKMDNNTSDKVLNPDIEKKEVTKSFKIKRLYLDMKTVLLHIRVDLNSDMIPLSAGVWDDVEVIYMRPVYCEGNVEDIRTCVGDFNEGIEWLDTRSRNTIELEEEEDYITINEFIDELMTKSDKVSDLMMEKCTDCEISISDTFNAEQRTIEYLNTYTDITTTDPLFTFTEPPNLQTTTLIQEITTTTYMPTQTTQLATTDVDVTTQLELSTTEISFETTTRLTTVEPMNTDDTDTTTIAITLTPPIYTDMSTTVANEESTTVISTTDTAINDATTDSTTLTMDSIQEVTTETPQNITSLPRSEELIEQILEDLEQLLQDETVPILIDDINETFDQVNNFLNEDQDVVFPGELLQLLNQVAQRVDLNGSLTGMVVRDNVAVLMADAGPENPVLGINVAARDTDEFTEESFDFNTEYNDQIPANITEVAVFLPLYLTSLGRRISFIVYSDDHAFNDPQGVYSVNSRVISINVANFTSFERGEVVNIHTNPRISDPGRNITRGCAYWHFLDDGAGYWSQDGCTFIRSSVPGTLDVCRCDHLTHFAEILIPRPVFSQLNEDILEVVSVIGCTISILGLLVTICTGILFKSWRKSFRNQVWLQLCISLFIMMICFIIAVFAKFNKYDVFCQLTGITLHYSLLASFCWMLVVATKSYRDLVVIFAKQVPRKLAVASSFSWGFPVVVVAILLLANPLSYLNRFEEMNPSSSFCYPSGLGLWLSVYAPVSLMLLANGVLFALIVRNIGVSPKNLRYQKAGDKREALNCARISFVLVFFFGLPWFFGLFAYNVVAAYFFTFTATLQGFMLFLFIVLGNFETRNLWLLTLRRQKIRNSPYSGRSVTMLY